MREFLLFFALCCVTPLAAQESGDLAVVVTGLKAGGELLLTLFDQPDGFPGDYAKSREYRRLDVVSSTMNVVFGKLPPGKYAIAVLHDENGNAVADTNFFGVPQEGVAVSNNVTRLFRAPTFEEAKIIHDVLPQVIVIRIKY